MLDRWISTRNETTAIARGGWLDAIRFIVAVLIVLHHFQAAGPIALAESLHPAFEHTGFLLTNLFIIDSGYVLMRLYSQSLATGQVSPGEFLTRRVLRVVPAHLMMGLALVALVVGSAALGLAPRNPEWFDWSQLPAQLGLVQAFGIPGGLGWNAPTWSISALIGCYLAFPWIVRSCARLGPWTWLVVGIGLYLIANELARALLGYPVYQMPMKFGFFRALPLFFLGMALAAFAHRVWINPALARWVGVLATVGLIALQFYGKNALPSLVMISLIILAAGAIPVARPSRLIERAALVSFSMFISNEVVRIAWFGVVNVAIARLDLSEPVQWALWFAGVGMAVAFAFAFHHMVDGPLQDWLKARTRHRSPAPKKAVRSAFA